MALPGPETGSTVLFAVVFAVVGAAFLAAAPVHVVVPRACTVRTVVDCAAWQRLKVRAAREGQRTWLTEQSVQLPAMQHVCNRQ